MYLNSYSCFYDVIGVSETNTLDNMEDFNIPGYDLLYNNSKLNKCDGFILYVRTEIIRDCHIIQVGSFRFVRAIINKNGDLLGITGTYRLPSTNVDDFLLELNNLYEQKIVKKFETEIFLGDINIDILRVGEAVVTDYMNCLYTLGFMGGINKPTRVRQGQRSSCLDHIFIKDRSDKFEPCLNIHCSGISDHYPVLLNLKTSIQKNCRNKNKEIVKLNFKKLNDTLANENWQEVLDSRDTNVCADKFVDTLKKHIDAATEKKYIKCKNRKLKPWITQALINSIRTRDRLKKQSVILKTPESHETFLQYRAKLDGLIKTVKNQYYQNKLDLANGDMKQTWKIIREATNERGQANCNITSIMGENGVEVGTEAEVAEEFNTYFSEIGKRMANRIDQPDVVFHVDSKDLGKSMFLRPINENELICQINSLKGNASPGDDNISANIIKHFHLKLLNPLLHLINLSYSTGIFPARFKHAVVIPIHKSGDKKALNNYRPIALTSSVAKLVERCMKLRLNEYLNENNVISPNQFGFREKHSTEDAVSCVADHIYQAINENKKCLVIFLDLGKAFDTVTHRILLEKMEQIGIRGVAHKLYKDYLSNRTQTVKILSTLSSNKTVEFGVPQGTVLGPVLFSIYINEIMKLVPDAEVVCFADDTAIIIKENSWQKVKQVAEEVISKIKAWFDKNYLTLNASKSCFVCFSMTRAGLVQLNELKELTIHRFDCLRSTQGCCNLMIERREQVKYLGVEFDMYLSWKKHVECVSGRIRKLIYKFYQLRQFMSWQMLKSVYFALVESILGYCISVWGATFKSILSPLVVTQKYVLKVMLHKKRRYPTEVLFREARILRVNQLYVKSVIRLLTRKSNYLHKIEHNKNTRNIAVNNVACPRAKSTKYQRYLLYTAPKLFNMLPQVFRVVSFKKIKHKLNNWLIDNNILWFCS